MKLKYILLLSISVVLFPPVLNAEENNKKIVMVNENIGKKENDTLINIGGSFVEWSGKITDKSVSALIDASKDNVDIREFSIVSLGGDVKSAIRLANWIKLRNMDVRVRDVCFSACANYVFFAGNKKIIEDYAFVAWHGDVFQKNFRELIQKYEEILGEKNLNNKFLNDEDEEFIFKNRIKYDSLKDLQRMHVDFYSSVGVNDDIGKVGQEPIVYKSDGWTVTLKLMEFYGVKNVVASEGYAKGNYFGNNPLSSIVNKGPLLVFDIDQDDNIYALPFPPPKKRKALNP